MGFFPDGLYTMGFFPAGLFSCWAFFRAPHKTNLTQVIRQVVTNCWNGAAPGTALGKKRRPLIFNGLKDWRMASFQLAASISGSSGTSNWLADIEINDVIVIFFVYTAVHIYTCLLSKFSEFCAELIFRDKILYACLCRDQYVFSII